jgi:hypothetical protein
MNQTIKKINEEKVLFFDLEVVRRNKDLDINSKEFELFQKKTRNIETDELLPDDEVVEQYNKRAALKMCYTKIVSVGVGFIKDGEVHIKALEGDEESVLRQFCSIANTFDYVCGANILGYDLPMVAVNGMRYFNVTENLVDRFLTSGKKSWNLDRCLDLMDIFKGTHYANTSLDEMCYHFNIPSPKTDLDGSMVSNEYWNNGLDKINSYVKQDVFAGINIFKKMRFEQPFEVFIDKNQTTTVQPFAEDLPILEKIYKATNLDIKTKEKLEKLLSKKKVTKKEKLILEDILVSLYIDNTMFASDKVEVKVRKKQEIKEILDAIK